MDNTKNCNKCGKPTKETKKGMCLYCYKKERAKILYEYIWEYLLKHPCVDCGETNPLVLQFDHVRGEKRKAISAMVSNSSSLGAIKKEIKKTDVRCANCHTIKTLKENNSYSYKIAIRNGLVVNY